MRLGFFLRQDSGGDLLVNPGVVVGQPRELPVAVEVRAAVAHVRKRENLPVEQARDDRRAHALQPRLRGHRRHDAFVGFLDRHGKTIAVEVKLMVVLEGPRRFFLLPGRGDELLDRVHGDLGRHFSGRVSAHAVGDDEETFVSHVPRKRVLVVLALPADVGDTERFDPRHVTPRLP